MKYACAVTLTLLLSCQSAAAQWQVPDHATPIGRGGGNQGFKSAGPCAAGVAVVGQGVTSDPACGRVNVSTGTSKPVRVITGADPVTVTTADYLVVVNKTIGAATPVTLPASPAIGDTYIVKDGKGDAWLNAITVAPAAGTIDGAPNYVLSIGYGAITFVYNGTQWNVL